MRSDRCSYKGFTNQWPNRRRVRIGKKIRPEIEAQLSNHPPRWWHLCSSNPRPPFRLLNRLLRLSIKRNSRVDIPPLPIPWRHSSIDTVTQKHLDMLNVFQEGLGHASIPQVERFGIQMKAIGFHPLGRKPRLEIALRLILGWHTYQCYTQERRPRSDPYVLDVYHRGY